MTQISEICRDLKKDFKPRRTDPTKPVSCWTEKDVLDGKIIDAFVIILKTRGCSWALNSGCSMCGYFNDSLWEKTSKDDIQKQFNNAMEKYNGEKFVKIFTSGSFLDENEMPSLVQKNILSKLFETCEKISVESRPEYVNDKKLSEIKKIKDSKNFEIGIGLETADDNIRKNCINKGFTYKDYEIAANKIKKYNMWLKTYVLVKPVFLSERQSINDAINTVDKIKKISQTISFNPTNVQRNTVVEYLWKRQRYRPPWLWSVVEILKESKKNAPSVFQKCDISGGGGWRGAHNCRNCDKDFLRSISEYSLYQDTKVFKNLDCECREKWLDQLDLEDLSFGSIVDIK